MRAKVFGLVAQTSARTRLTAKDRTAVILGEEPMLLGFTFEDGVDKALVERPKLMEALSTGEKKALYLLFHWNKGDLVNRLRRIAPRESLRSRREHCGIRSIGSAPITLRGQGQTVEYALLKHLSPLG